MPVRFTVLVEDEMLSEHYRRHELRHNPIFLLPECPLIGDTVILPGLSKGKEIRLKVIGREWWTVSPYGLGADVWDVLLECVPDCPPMLAKESFG